MTTCNCAVMTKGLDEFYRQQDMRLLFENGHKKLDEIPADDWMIIRAIVAEDSKYKQELKEQAERIQEMKKRFGK